MAKQEQWGSRAGFILAAVGSAIGLGNIWRFPYMVYENGGGAFLIPYFIALITAGIPIIILEFAIGHKFSGSAPVAIAKAKKSWEWLGWWQVLIAFVIAVYYVIIISWAMGYMVLSLNLGWGENTNDFFFTDFLQITDSPFNLGGIVPNIFVGLVVVWSIVWLALSGGVKKGIEKANKIFIPLLAVLFLILMVRSVFLDGALDGLNWLFQPDFSRLGDFSVWTAAYGQIFFTLSISFAIMITYSSYLPKDSDVSNNGLMTAFFNCGFSMLAGIMIFSVLGFMAKSQGVPLQEVVSAGVGLAFVTIPKAINYMPGARFFGVIFFLSLVFAGLSSAISIVEVVTASFRDKVNLSRKKAATLACIVGFLVSIIFASRAGLLVLDIVDHFINNLGIVFTGLVEVLMFGWMFKLESFREYINELSDVHVGKWWNISIKIITPLVLGYMAVRNLVSEIKNPYGGYDLLSLVVYGWAIVIVVLILGVLIHKTSRKNILEQVHG